MIYLNIVHHSEIVQTDMYHMQRSMYKWHKLRSRLYIQERGKY